MNQLDFCLFSLFLFVLILGLDKEIYLPVLEAVPLLQTPLHLFLPLSSQPLVPACKDNFLPSFERLVPYLSPAWFLALMPHFSKESWLCLHAFRRLPISGKDWNWFEKLPEHGMFIAAVVLSSLSSLLQCSDPLDLSSSLLEPHFSSSLLHVLD